MNQKPRKFNSSFLLFVVTILLIGGSIPAWINKEQAHEIKSLSMNNPLQVIIEDQNQMIEEFQQQLSEADLSQSIPVKQDVSLEIVEQQLPQFPEALPESMVEGKMNHDDPVSC